MNFAVSVGAAVALLEFLYKHLVGDIKRRRHYYAKAILTAIMHVSSSATSIYSTTPPAEKQKRKAM
jgi:hypothetical protein